MNYFDFNARRTARKPWQRHQPAPKAITQERVMVRNSEKRHSPMPKAEPRAFRFWQR